MPQKRMRVWCPLMSATEHELGERLAARTLELIDIPSESRDEARLAEHVRGLLPDARDLGDTCVLAGPDGARVLLGGHLDTVPAQGNRPGRRDAERVFGLGASDMKGALAVMIELVRDGVPFGALLFGREELPFTESALTPLLARHPLRPELVVMMEPTDNAIHAGCLGNINATWSFHGVAGHSARPWFADNAIHRAAAGIAALAEHEPEPHDFDGLRFVEVASVTKIAGGIASNVVPDLAEATLNYRYAPGRTRGGRGAAGRAVRRPWRAADRRPRTVGRGRARPAGGRADRRRRPRNRAQAGLDPGGRVRDRRPGGRELRARRPAAGAHARGVDLGRRAGARLPRPRATASGAACGAAGRA